MKNHSITIRLSEDEFEKLQKIANLENTSISQYIRECINGVEPKGVRDIQTAVEKICAIYIELNKIKSDDSEKIMEGMDKLCQILY